MAPGPAPVPSPAVATTPGPPDVRVGIVSYNTAGLLERCLAALPAALDGLEAEVVVVDNASRDDSVAVARAAGATVVANVTNVGYSRAMNVALAGTQADTLVALNPDTDPRPGSLRTLVDVLRADPAVGLAVPRLVNPDGSLQHSVHRFPTARLALVEGLVPHPLRRGRLGQRLWLHGFAAHDDAALVDWAVGAVHVIRRAALGDPDHAYSERTFMYAEDLELCFRLHEHGWRVVFDPDAEVVHVLNAAGAVEFGEARDDRWLGAAYDWYAGTHGATAARAWAAANCTGLAAKWVVASVVGRPNLRRTVGSLLRIHARHLISA